MSYEMAEQLFKRCTGGKTLHQLRHPGSPTSARRTSAPPLMAIGGHKRPATLKRYVQPSQATGAAAGRWRATRR